MRHLLLLLPLLLLTTSTASAQAFTISYSFTGAAGNEPTLDADNDPTGVAPSVISRGPGIAPASASGTFSSNGYATGAGITEAVAEGDYFEFTVAPESGYSFSLTSLDFATQRSSTGPPSGELRSSADNYASTIGGSAGAIIAHPTAKASVGPFDLSSAPFQRRTQPITFRLYSYGGTSTNGTLRIDDLTITGTAVSASGQSVTVSLRPGSASVVEGSSTSLPESPIVIITTSDGAALVSAVTVQLQFSPSGSGGQPGDIAGLPITLTFPAGAGSGTGVARSITAVSDGLVEGPEVVALVLGGATGASIASSSSTYTLMINDPAGQTVTVSLGAPTSATVMEGGSAAMTVRVVTSDGLAVGEARTVDVDLLGGGNATVQDFTGFSDPTRLTIAAGTASGSELSLTVRTLDDNVFEGTESFTFALTNASANTAISSPISFYLTINDNDLLGQTTVCPGQRGSALLACIRQQFTPAMVYPYNQARDTLFAFVDDGERSRITDLYVGRVLPLLPGQDPTGAGCNGDKDGNSSTCSGPRTINTEHVWPQSLGAQTGRPEGDMHHLYPSRGDVNTVRSNNPFGEFSYRTAQALYRDTLSYTFSTLPNVSDTLSYSAYRGSVFMPRASVRGDIARALFYFRAIYEAEATAAGGLPFFEGMKATLLRWNREDAVRGEDVSRSQRVKRYQGNDNPFVLDTTLAARAFGGPGTAVDDAQHAWERLRVYPSPARDVVRATGFTGEADVLDVLGRRVAVLRAGEALEVAAWPRGLYALRAGSRTVVFILVQ